MEKQERICVSAKEAAELMGLSQPTFRKLMRTDGFPVFRVAKKCVIPLSELERWLAERATKKES